MNSENLHELINRYEDNLDLIYNEEHDELFKWRAMYTWQQEWRKPEDAFVNFAERFNAASKDFDLLTDNSRMHPSAGVVKLWEKEPKTVEALFYDVLFAEPDGSVEAVHNYMEAFLDGFEKLRQKYFAGNWSYKQDRHSASVYLAMNDPEFNYVFKSSEATTMAKYVDFGFHIGTGESFSLVHYYKLCEDIISALREHRSLLDKHFARLDEGCYVDNSLHLLAFDLMYCSRAYHFYNGLVAPVTGKTIKKRKLEITQEELARRENERLERIAALEQEITELENSCDGCEDISLLDVQVTSEQYGDGMVTAQDINKITVEFTDVKKSFVIDKKYTMRPRFENDDEIVEAFTNYGNAQAQIRKLRSEIKRLKAEN